MSLGNWGGFLRNSGLGWICMLVPLLVCAVENKPEKPNVVFIMAVALLMFLVFRSMAKRYQKSTMPRGLGRFLEPLVLFVRDEHVHPRKRKSSK